MFPRRNRDIKKSKPEQSDKVSAHTSQGPSRGLVAPMKFSRTKSLTMANNLPKHVTYNTQEMVENPIEKVGRSSSRHQRSLTPFNREENYEELLAIKKVTTTTRARNVSEGQFGSSRSSQPSTPSDKGQDKNKYSNLRL